MIVEIFEQKHRSEHKKKCPRIDKFYRCLLLKDFHYHNTSYHGSDTASVSHNASLKQVCSTCDFTMHESVEAKATVFQPVVAISWVPKRIFTEQTVYQAVVSINSHSPPTVG